MGMALYGEAFGSKKVLISLMLDLAWVFLAEGIEILLISSSSDYSLLLQTARQGCFILTFNTH